MRRWRHLPCALVLLAALAGCGHPVDPSVVDPFEVLREKLAQTVSVDFSGLPLETALAELAEQSGVAIRIDREALDEAGDPLTDPVTLRVRDIPLRSVLHLLLDDTYREFVFQDDALCVTSREEAYATLVPRLYHVADLTRRERAFDEDALADAVKELVAADRWEDAGGTGTIEVRPGALLVRQACSVHLQIAALFDALRSAGPVSGGIDAPDAEPAGNGGPSAAIQRALDSRLTIDLNRAPEEVFREIETRYGVNVVVWCKSPEAERAAAELGFAPGTSLTLTDVTLHTALDLMLEPLGIGWTVRNDVIMVLPGDDAGERLSLRAYPVPTEVIVPRYQSGRALPRPWWAKYEGDGLSEFLDDLEELISSDLWRDAGGPGHVAEVSSRIVVAQTERVHGQLTAWFDKLRRATDPRVLDYDERATSPQAERLWRALERPVTVNFSREQCSLRQALKALGQQHGVPNIFIDDLGLGDANFNASYLCPPFAAHDVSLAAALDLLLSPLGLGWYVRDNVLVVTSRERVDTAQVNLAYRCPCLADGQADSMIELVKSFVRPDSWRDAGGPGDGLWVFGNVLSVTQSQRNHEEVRQFLRQWQAVHDAVPGGPPLLVTSPAEERLYAALDQPVRFSCADQPLKTAVAQLARQPGNIAWDWRHIADAVEDPHVADRRVTFQATTEPAGRALTRLLRPHGLDWTCASDGLCVTTSEIDATRLITSFYKLPHSLGAPTTDKDALLDLVTSHVHPDSWSDSGGPGQVDLVSGNILVVSHSWAVHGEVRLLLRQLAAAFEAPGGTWTFAVPPDEQSLLTKLQQPITYAGRDQPFAEVLAALAERSGVPIALDEPALDDPVIPELQAARLSLEAKDEPLLDVLARLLGPRGLQWTAHQGGLRVTRLAGDDWTTGFYKLPQELARAPGAEALADAIEYHIRPGFWTGTGSGVGSVDVVSRSVLVLSQTRSVHDEVRHFLRQLQAALGAPGGAAVYLGPSSDESSITGFHRLPDDVVAAVMSAIVPMRDDPSWLAEDCLFEWICELCESPESGTDEFGEGAVDVLTAHGGKSAVIVVTNTRAVHERIANVLARLRRSPRLSAEELQRLREIQDDIRKRAGLGIRGHVTVIPVVG
jgi:hypothetical protein